MDDITHRFRPYTFSTRAGLRCGCRIVSAEGNADIVHLRLVARVGSLLETSTQTGSAHFIEHLGFRGTRMFDHGQLISKVQSFGSSFGPDLNARTSLCETVWQLDLPLNRLEEGLEVLREWAFWIRISEEDVEAERKVILEEWRQKQTASQRTKQKFWSLAAPLVGDRLPIGTKEFISSVTAQELRKFYLATYIPENLSVVCVLECSNKLSHLQDHYQDFRRVVEHVFAPSNCRLQSPRIRPQFPPNLAALRPRRKDLELDHINTNHLKVACVVDPDLSVSAVSLEFLSDAVEPSASESFIVREILKRLLSSIFDERFRESRLEGHIQRSPSVSFGLAVQRPYVEMSGVRIELPSKATCADVRFGIQFLLRELLTAFVHGFSKDEVNHAKAKWRRHFRERKQSSWGSCEEMVEYFSLGERTLLLSFQEEQEKILLLLEDDSGIDAKQVAEMCREWLQPLMSSLSSTPSASMEKSNATSSVVLCFLQGPNVPEGFDDEALGESLRLAFQEETSELAMVKAQEEEEQGGKNKKIRSSVFQENALRMMLQQDVDNLLLSSASTHNDDFVMNESRERLEASDAEFITYSVRDNKRIRMCIKRTTNKQISLQAYAIGGATDLSDARDDVALCLLGDALRESGLGRLSGMELARLESLSGTRVFLQRHLHHRGIGGSCPNEYELRTMLQMVLTRTQMIKCDSGVLDRLKNREIESITSMTASSMGDETVAVRELAFGTMEPLLRPHNVEDVRATDKDKLLQVALRGFQPLNDFVFCMIGSITDETPLREFARVALQCLTSKADNKQTMPWLEEGRVSIRPMQLQFFPCPKPHVVYAGKTFTDKSQVYIVMRPNDCFSYVESPMKDFMLDAACEAIRTRMIGRLRTNRGEVYSVQTDHSRTPLSPQARVFVSFSCDGNRDCQLAEHAQLELHEAAVWGFSDEESSAALSIVKQRIARSNSTDSHTLFRLLDGLRATGNDVKQADLIASQHFVDDLVRNEVRFKDSLKTITRELVSNGIACLVVRYRPQKL